MKSPRFDNTFRDELPGEAVAANHPREVLGAAWSAVDPTPMPAPKVLAWSAEVASELGWSDDDVRDPAFAEVFGGNKLLDGMAPWAACYGGHQFGQWAGQLGDGRAISLGEAVTPTGGRLELQLKGAGPTPYSRRGDGRAVLRSSIREFLCSEAMHHMGIPTTRALSLVATGEPVLRDMFYDGHPKMEPGAIVCRVAPTFLRFGNFQLAAARGDLDLLGALGAYALRHHFPQLGPPSAESYAAMFAEIACRTAEMVVHWMRVGFVHGVMNTDNMSLLGQTIDYGPYGFLDDFDPHWTPNTTDAHGRRYRYAHQPAVAHWNLAQFANALVPLIGEPAPLETGLQAFRDTLDARTDAMFAAKLGLREHTGELDAHLMDELFALLAAAETDMTIFFRALARVPSAAPPEGADGDEALVAVVHDALYTPDTVPDDHLRRLAAWLRRYVARVAEDGDADADRRARMNATNPVYIFRNYIAQLAIDRAEQGDPSLVSELLDMLRHPYDEQPRFAEYAGKRPDWARHRPGCSMLSCSS